jgi:hypothetical protein
MKRIVSDLRVIAGDTRKQQEKGNGQKSKPPIAGKNGRCCATVTDVVSLS